MREHRFCNVCRSVEQLCSCTREQKQAHNEKMMKQFEIERSEVQFCYKPTIQECIQVLTSNGYQVTKKRVNPKKRNKRK